MSLFGVTLLLPRLCVPLLATPFRPESRTLSIHSSSTSFMLFSFDELSSAAEESDGLFLRSSNTSSALSAPYSLVSCVANTATAPRTRTASPSKTQTSQRRDTSSRLTTDVNIFSNIESKKRPGSAFMPIAGWQRWEYSLGSLAARVCIARP